MEEDDSDCDGGLINIDSEGALEFVRGRDLAEFVQLRSEIHRTRVSLFSTEMERIEATAKVKVVDYMWKNCGSVMSRLSSVNFEMTLPNPEMALFLQFRAIRLPQFFQI